MPGCHAGQGHLEHCLVCKYRTSDIITQRERGRERERKREREEEEREGEGTVPKHLALLKTDRGCSSVMDRLEKCLVAAERATRPAPSLAQR